MSHCHTCKFATWQKTKTGRPSRALAGRCTWEKKVVVSASTSTSNWGQRTKGEPLELKGGAIWRADRVNCPTYVREN